MHLFNENADLSPRIAAGFEIVQIIRDELVLAYGMGAAIADCSDGELGGTWNPNEDATITKQPHWKLVFAAAIANVKDWARDMEAMYCRESMEATITQALNFAYECGRRRDMDTLTKEFHHAI